MIAALFVRSDGHYMSDPRCDGYDIHRDARSWPGGCSVVAHPPCRAWGRLKHFAKPREGEKELGLWAADQVRAWGGVLEHPADSSLWKATGLPRPGHIDSFGGYTLHLDQFRWGHRAEKMTWFYICGVPKADLPEIPERPEGLPSHVVTNIRGIRKGHPRWRPELSKSEREMTPPRLANWLVQVAQKAEQLRPNA